MKLHLKITFPYNSFHIEVRIGELSLVFFLTPKRNYHLLYIPSMFFQIAEF